MKYSKTAICVLASLCLVVITNCSRGSLVSQTISTKIDQGIVTTQEGEITIKASTAGRDTLPFSSPENINALVKGNTDFAVDMYKKLSSPDGNLFFSPYSISIALAMTWAGARGQTESEMASALHFPLDQTQLHPAFDAPTLPASF